MTSHWKKNQREQKLNEIEVKELDIVLQRINKATEWDVRVASRIK